MRNWGKLLPEMLHSICDRLSSFENLVAFAGVCSSWRRVVNEQNLGLPLSPIPWLMLAENQNDDRRDFYSITEGKTYSLNLPELKGKRCMESKGWIITASDKGEMALVQPLKRVQIPLPHQNTSWCYDEHPMDPLIFVKKVVLSTPPHRNNERDCMVVISHGGHGNVGFCRPGDKVWTVVENFSHAGIMSIEYYRGKLYVLNVSGKVGEYDLITKSNGTSHVPLRIININIQYFIMCKTSYLVNFGASLLVVSRKYISGEDYDAIKFLALEIDIELERDRKVKSLGTRAIFLGHSASMYVDTSRCPELHPNSIYFTDDQFESYIGKPKGGGMNMGVYDIKERRVRPHYNGKSLSVVCPPVWTLLTTK